VAANNAGDASRATRHLGLDLGGTNIKWVVVENTADAWRVLDQDEVPTYAERGPDTVIERLAEIGAQAIARCDGVVSAGVGVPGLYNPADGTTRLLPNLPGDWTAKPMAAVIRTALNLPTHVVNDARAFGLAELRLGAGRGASSMVGFTLGTGVGGVFAVDGKVYQGHDGTGGELGHQTLEPDGPLCKCGNRGCLEAYARADRIAQACGTDTAEEAFERARAGDAKAAAGIARVGTWLGIGIANTVVMLTPDCIVIGGGVAAAADMLLPYVQAQLEERVHVTSLDRVRVTTAQLGVWAGAIGAAVHGAEIART
jgi:glucokinase